jgi:folate-binding protein YgfZ
LTFEGADAAAFLHGQLSSDVAAMAEGAVAWTSYNSAKGRMLATLLLWRRTPEAYAAFVASDLAEPLRKRLSMFVLRSSVKVADLTSTGVRCGVAGVDARAAIHAALSVDLRPGFGAQAADAWAVALPDGRFLVHAPNAVAAAVRDRLLAHARAVPPGHWDWLQVRAGIPMITRATQDLFVPQTANWDLVGGLDFRKGCYPGQEIVARMQYLGRLKERLFAYHAASAAPAPATPIFSPAFGEPACGIVVNAASSPAGGSDLLAVVQWSAAHNADLHLGTADGPVLVSAPLPYDVPAPTAPNRPKL